MSHPAFCGISGPHLGELAAELGARCEARCESARHERRGGVRRREAGDGPKYGLVFVDRLLATLVHLRTGLTYEALGVIYEVGSSTISRAICEMRPLLAARGFAVPDRPGVRLRTLEDVFAYAEAEHITLRIVGRLSLTRPRARHIPGVVAGATAD
ncbi:helix-turn-helix domain-containing protein [Streptomyces mirabilis]|uniref:helix-turn-helix domain-containing protein n=1 Tax=Streptomyces mirabilis TaxID=68239 RepID=UPI00331EE77F